MIPDTPLRTTRAGTVQRLSRWVMETDHKYLMHGDRRDPVTLPWMPYQAADFISIMWDCMAETDGTVFLDVGCGPGTKMRIANLLFGLTVYGIEIDPVMQAEASQYGRAYLGDALSIPSIECIYRTASIIWLYRPFRDAEHERKLEEVIIENMRPGAILAGGSWETDVPALGWQPIVDDCLHGPDGVSRIWRGAWQKPRTE